MEENGSIRRGYARVEENLPNPPQARGCYLGEEDDVLFLAAREHKMSRKIESVCNLKPEVGAAF